MQNHSNKQTGVYDADLDYTEVDMANDIFEELKLRTQIRCRLQQQEDNLFLSAGRLLFNIILIIGILFLCVAISKT